MNARLDVLRANAAAEVITARGEMAMAIRVVEDMTGDLHRSPDPHRDRDLCALLNQVQHAHDAIEDYRRALAVRDALRDAAGGGGA